MAHFNQFSINFQINPPLQAGTSVGVQQSPHALVSKGLNMLVEVSTATAFVTQQPAAPTQRRTIAVMAHFDTGASLTTIDQNLAAHLNLVSTGSSQISTANGVTNTPNYAIDIAFLNTRLRTIQNLQVSSCTLSGFNLQNALQNPNNPTNFGLLIGRDIMSLWNIVWNGPTSTVFISD